MVGVATWKPQIRWEQGFLLKTKRREGSRERQSGEAEVKGKKGGEDTEDDKGRKRDKARKERNKPGERDLRRKRR